MPGPSCPSPAVSHKSPKSPLPFFDKPKENSLPLDAAQPVGANCRGDVTYALPVAQEESKEPPRLFGCRL